MIYIHNYFAAPDCDAQGTEKGADKVGIDTTDAAQAFLDEADADWAEGYTEGRADQAFADAMGLAQTDSLGEARFNSVPPNDDFPQGQTDALAEGTLGLQVAHLMGRVLNGLNHTMAEKMGLSVAEYEACYAVLDALATGLDAKLGTDWEDREAV